MRKMPSMKVGLSWVERAWSHWKGWRMVERRLVLVFFSFVVAVVGGSGDDDVMVLVDVLVFEKWV